jgi:Leucine-rich repeat (LRR) protein
LNLWKQCRGSVPHEVWLQTDLETLVLADNELTEVPEEIGRLRALRMLDLGHNKLGRVPPWAIWTISLIFSTSTTTS